MSIEKKIDEATEKKLMLTIEDIDSQECFKNLPYEQKLELILLIYEISLALYHSYSNNDE